MQTLRAFLETTYPALAPIQSVEALDAPLVSSRIYQVRCPRGIYCLKIPGYARSQGESPSERRAAWQLIHEVRRQLRNQGVSMEDVLPTHDDQLLTEYDGHICWLTPYYDHRPFAGTETDVRHAGHALGAFHAAGLRVLGERPDLRDAIRARLRRDMPIQDSLKAYPDLRRELHHPDFAERYPHCRPVLSDLEHIREAWADVVDPLGHWAAQRLRQPLQAQTRLTHNDFHPANVLFLHGNDIVILDLEQMGEGPLVKCMALALTRFTLETLKLQPNADASAAIQAFHSGYAQAFSLPSSDLKQLPDWIRLYELEKILRILRRALAGEVYPAMIRKIITHHLHLCREADRFTP